MEHEFVGRREERALLEDAYRGEASAFIPVYGRRRVGKSELILRFLQDRPAVYVVGKQAPAALQIRELLEAAARAWNQPLLATQAVEGWAAALRALAVAAPAGRKWVLALDEFQWMAQASPELPSILQELWDREWKRGGRMMLILCGSFVGFMEREVLGQKSPLYGRRTGLLRLHPLPYHEAAELHRAWPVEERAKVYFLCGGVPHYLRMFDPRASLESGIIRHLLDSHGALHREPDFLLREELREVEKYHALLTSLGEGAGSPSLLAARSGIPERSLSYYLNALIDLGYVRKRQPLTEGRPSPRGVRYGMADPLLAFWFRFVFRETSLLASLGPERFFRERIRPELEAWWGGRFEALCREALPHLLRREGAGALEAVGEYWDARVQIDVVGRRTDGWTELGECKWGSVRSWTSLEAELEAKRAAYPNPANRMLHGRLFVRRAPAGKRPAACHELEELYRAASGKN